MINEYRIRIIKLLRTGKYHWYLYENGKCVQEGEEDTETDAGEQARNWEYYYLNMKDKP